jgi:hypothetical protein
MHRTRRRPAVIAAATIALIAAFAATAVAFVTTSSGKAQVSMSNVTENAPISTSSTTWVDLNSTIPLSVPSDGLLVNARFTAESLCTQKAGICRVRIVADDGNTLTELEPVSGLDFAFDTSTGNASIDDLAEGHAMERSLRLKKGEYRIRVQYSVSAGSTKFTLDDWHFAIEASE